MAKLVTPECCEDAKYFGNVFLSLNVYSGDSSQKKPKWAMMQLDINSFFSLHPELDIRSRKWDVEPKFCPYCSTALPEIKPRETTEKICKVTDGGYYCDTCEERLHACTCYPPEYAWKVTKD